MSGNRRLVTVLGLVAAAVLFWMVNPWFTPADIGPAVQTAATVSFWILSIALVVLLFGERKNAGATEVQVEGPAFARFLFSNTAGGPLLAADPPVPWLHVARGRLAQAHGRPGWTRWRLRAARATGRAR